MRVAARFPRTVGLLVLAACAPDLPQPSYDIPVTELTSTVLHTGDHLGGPIALEVADGRLLVVDGIAQRGLHIVSLEDGGLVRSLGPIGDGPGEFRQPVAITLDGEGRPWIADMALQRLTRVDMNRLADPAGWAPETITLQNVPYFWDIAWTGDNRLLAGGQFSEGRFGILDANGRLLGVRGAYPPLDEDVPEAVLQGIYTPEITSNLAVGAVVSATRWDDRIEVWNSDGRLVREIAAPVPVTPVYDLIDKQGFVVPGFDRSRAAYLSVATTDEHIFALFSARTAVEWEDRQLFGRDVHVFDWDGRLVSVLRLDRDALVLTVDPERRRLLTVEWDPAPAIRAYDLPVWTDASTRVASLGPAGANE